MRLIFLFFLICKLGVSQSIFSEVISLKLHDSIKIKKIDSLIQSRDKDVPFLDSLTYNYSLWLYKRNIEKSIKAASLSVKYSNLHTPNKILKNQYRLYILGQFYYFNKEYQKALKTLNDAVKLKDNSPTAAGAISYIGDVYHEKGDYYMAIDYFEVSEQLYYSNNYHKKLNNLYLKIFESYRSLKTIENLNKAKSYILKADSLSEIYPQSVNNTFKRNVLLGDIYNEFETLDIPRALIYYNKAHELALKLNDSIKLGMALSLKGDLYNTTNLDKAISYHRKSLRIRKKVKPKTTFINYGNLGYCYYRKQELDTSIYYYNEALKVKTGFSIYKHKRKKLLFQSDDLENILLILTYIGEAYHDKGDDKSIEKAVVVYLLADEVLDLIRISSKEKKSRLFWREQASGLYEKSIKASYATNNIEKLFYFIEKNKAIILQEDIIYNKLKENNRIPKNIIIKENSIEKQIYINENIAFSNNSDSLRISLLNHKKELEVLNDSIKKYTPFYTNRASNIIIPLKEVQLSVMKNESIIEYVVFEETIYGIFISKNKVNKFKIENLEIVKTNIKKYLNLISKPFSNKNDLKDYKVVANELFNSFIPKSIQKYINKGKLTVIQDNYLAKIPFESFINNDGDYLIEQIEINYQLSNSFLNTISERKSNINTIAVFAPENFKTGSLQSLPNTIIEAEVINNVIPVVLFDNNKAVKSSFLNELLEHNILHLATHANANDSISPWIAFYDKKITLEELYLTKNNADLVVLSACQTNTGKLEVGEGVMSLSRGFFQTGARSLVSSLWNVDDKSTAIIMKTFYENLVNKNDKSKSLRNAKLDYIKKSSLSEASPYYWASFVLIGKTDVIYFTKNNNWEYWCIGFFMIFSIIFFLIKYRSS